MDDADDQPRNGEATDPEKTLPAHPKSRRSKKWVALAGVSVFVLVVGGLVVNSQIAKARETAKANKASERQTAKHLSDLRAIEADVTGQLQSATADRDAVCAAVTGATTAAGSASQVTLAAEAAQHVQASQAIVADVTARFDKMNASIAGIDSLVGDAHKSLNAAQKAAAKLNQAQDELKKAKSVAGRIDQKSAEAKKLVAPTQECVTEVNNQASAAQASHDQKAAAEQQAAADKAAADAAGQQQDNSPAPRRGSDAGTANSGSGAASNNSSAKPNTGSGGAASTPRNSPGGGSSNGAGSGSSSSGGSSSGGGGTSGGTGGGAGSGGGSGTGGGNGTGGAQQCTPIGGPFKGADGKYYTKWNTPNGVITWPSNGTGFPC